MKLTAKKLKQMILETMYSPYNIVDAALEDPDVHPKIKDLLTSGDKSSITQAIEMIPVLYPDKYGTGNIEDRLEMGNQAYDQAVKSKMGDYYTKIDPEAPLDPVLGSKGYRDEVEAQAELRKLSTSIGQWSHKYRLLYNMSETPVVSVGWTSFSFPKEAAKAGWRTQNFPQDKYTKVTLVEIGMGHRGYYVSDLFAVSDIIKKLEKDGFVIQSMRSPSIQQQLDLSEDQVEGIERKRGFNWHLDRVSPTEAERKSSFRAETRYSDILVNGKWVKGEKKYVDLIGLSFYINKQKSREFDI